MATPYKILVLGKSKAGKKQLINRMRNKTFVADYEETITIEFAELKIASTDKTKKAKCDVWITSGNLRFQAMTRTYYPNTSIALYCIDLSEDNVDVDAIQSDIDALPPGCKVVLVGTKADLVAEHDNINKLAQITKKLTISGEGACIVTSAKDENHQNIDRLYEKICTDFWRIDSMANKEAKPGHSGLVTLDQPTAIFPHPEAPGFLKKHMQVILKSTAIGALAGGTAGLVIGVGLGVGMSVTGAIPTFGLSILAAPKFGIPLMGVVGTAAGALIGAFIGLMVGLAIASYREYQENKERRNVFFDKPIRENDNHSKPVPLSAPASPLDGFLLPDDPEANLPGSDSFFSNPST